MSDDVTQSPPLSQIDSVFTRYANFTLDGASATVAVMHRELLDKRRWLNLDNFTLCFALARLTPGINLLAFCTGVGWLRRSWLAGVALAVMPYSSLDAASVGHLYRPQVGTTQQVKSDSNIFDSLLGKSDNKGGVATSVDKSKDQQKQVAWCNAAGVKVTRGKSEQLEFMTVILPVRPDVNEQTMLQQMQRILRQSSVAMAGRGQCMFAPDKKEQIDQLKQRRANFVQVMQARRIEVVELFVNNFPPNLLGDSPTRPR